MICARKSKAVTCQALPFLIWNQRLFLFPSLPWRPQKTNLDVVPFLPGLVLLVSLPILSYNQEVVSLHCLLHTDGRTLHLVAGVLHNSCKTFSGIRPSQFKWSKACKWQWMTEVKCQDNNNSGICVGLTILYAAGLNLCAATTILYAAGLNLCAATAILYAAGLNLCMKINVVTDFRFCVRQSDLVCAKLSKCCMSPVGHRRI